MTKPLRLVASLAHPDDETFGLGGVLAYYALRGVEVYVLCATRGEAGTVLDPSLLEGYASLAERREAELRCAAEALGLADVVFLGYRDSGMPGSPDHAHPQALVNAAEEEVAARLREHLERLRPQVVITFDPIGGYFHPDHIQMHRATTRAFFALRQDYEAGRTDWAPQKLYYHFFPRHRLRWLVRIMPLFGLDPRHRGTNRDIDLVAIAEASRHFRTHACIRYGEDVLARVQQAIQCHASQLHTPRLSWRERLFHRLAFSRRPEAHFMRAYPAWHPGDPVEDDLFQGITP